MRFVRSSNFGVARLLIITYLCPSDCTPVGNMSVAREMYNFTIINALELGGMRMGENWSPFLEVKL
jgi:hypothetical protein